MLQQIISFQNSHELQGHVNSIFYREITINGIKYTRLFAKAIIETLEKAEIPVSTAYKMVLDPIIMGGPFDCYVNESSIVTTNRKKNSQIDIDAILHGDFATLKHISTFEEMLLDDETSKARFYVQLMKRFLCSPLSDIILYVF